MIKGLLRVWLDYTTCCNIHWVKVSFGWKAQFDGGCQNPHKSNKAEGICLPGKSTQHSGIRLVSSRVYRLALIVLIILRGRQDTVYWRLLPKWRLWHWTCRHVGQAHWASHQWEFSLFRIISTGCNHCLATLWCNFPARKSSLALQWHENILCFYCMAPNFGRFWCQCTQLLVVRQKD